MADVKGLDETLAKQLARKYDPEVEVQLREWMASLFEKANENENSYVLILRDNLKTFQEILRNGEILCAYSFFLSFFLFFSFFFFFFFFFVVVVVVVVVLLCFVCFVCFYVLFVLSPNNLLDIPSQQNKNKIKPRLNVNYN